MLESRRHATAVAVSIAMLTTGEHAVAQSTSEQTAPELETRLEAGALMSQRAGIIPLSAMALTPGIRFADKRIAASARGSGWFGNEGWRLGDADANFEAYAPLLYGVRAEVAASANRLFLDPSVESDQLNAQGRLHFMRERLGVWLGSGVARPLGVATVSNVNISSAGIWSKFGSATIRGSVTSFLFTKSSSKDTVENSSLCSQIAPSSAPAVGNMANAYGADNITTTTGCHQQSRLTDVEGSVRWEHTRLELTVRGGQRFGDKVDVTSESRQWASAQAAIWLSSQLAAVAGGGHEPAQPTRGLPARSYASLGMMLAYWPIPRGTVPIETPASMVRMFELRPAGTALQRLTARIGGVETVEVMGDFTDWTPIALVRRGRDMWELLIPMMPGMHQINLRIDGGEWIAPPGVPAMKDGFNGEVGILVVRP